MKKSIHTPEYTYFKERLRQAREQADMTQVEAAEKLGRQQSYISNIERGEQRVDIVELQRLAKLYGKPLGFFVKK
ncbi:MAG TPA: helix-turn-helix transcriptional regulator [Candidatus Paceibacterota bacterium]|nr:helix-turn-helix transcriptional regulator [Candidatus Paceibacterota bacterium]